MSPPGRRWPLQVFRVASLVVPSALAWYVAFEARHPGELTVAVKYALGPLWLLLAGALVIRGIEALVRGGRGTGASFLTRMDLLTAAGSSLSWFSAFAIMMSVWVGWASLAVVGLLGTGLFHLVVLATIVAVRGEDPIGRASVSRRFVPEVASEGDDVIEELRFSGVRIPAGFRLFATAQIGPRWPTSRYAVEATESGGDIVLETEIGPAVRGEHEAEPVDLWLQDTFGLCRSMRVSAGAARLSVLPQLRVAEGTTALLDRGPGPREPQPASRLPTEGTFRLRTYQSGDDVRRIHWMRSQAARELIVRLPDEIPPDRPRVRLVLDTFFADATELTCDAPSELLDALVGVWLAVGRSLAEAGTRVTLVAASSSKNAAITTVSHELNARAPARSLRLGAQIGWQSALPLRALLTDEATLIVSRGVQDIPRGRSEVRWIVVPANLVCSDVPWRFSSPAQLTYPMGSAENRGSRWRAVRERTARARRDFTAFMALRVDLKPLQPGSFVAFTRGDTVHLEAMR